MAADYKKRLNNLRNRRLGLDDYGFAIAKAQEFAERGLLAESYERRATSEALKYALGAMQEVDPQYTRVSIEEGDRVRRQLESGLHSEGIPVEFDYQGSVPLNVHIRGVSDVDLLVLHGAFFTYDGTGLLAMSYVPRVNGNILGDMFVLRGHCESILDARFPAATVDKTGAKSVSIAGGSLRRKVDVVPSHWHDGVMYQASGQKHHREIRILDKHELLLLPNRPFLHMKEINDKDIRTQNGTKKIIRLLKNLRNDADQDIALSSYDVASLVWHFDDAALNKPPYLEVALIAETQLHLQALVNNPSTTMALTVPDRSRKIIDSTNKWNALIQLLDEVDQLAKGIAHELNPLMIQTPEIVRRNLLDARV